MQQQLNQAPDELNTVLRAGIKLLLECFDAKDETHVLRLLNERNIFSDLLRGRMMDGLLNVEDLRIHLYDIDMTFQDGNTLLTKAAAWGSVPVLEKLLSEPGIKIDKPFQDSRHCLSAIHIAAQNGHLSAVKLLVEKGADLKTKALVEGKEVDVIQLAKQNNHTEVADYLEGIVVGKNPSSSKNSKNRVDLTGDLPNQNIAQKQQFVPKLKLVDEFPNDLKLLLEYIEKQDETAAMHQLAKMKTGHKFQGEQLDAFLPDKGDLTLLIISIIFKLPKLVEMLLKEGANIHQVGVGGMSALDIAVRYNSLSIVKILLNHDKTIVNDTSKNVTPLHLAAFNGNDSIVEFLLENDEEVNAKATEDSESFHNTVDNEYFDIVKLFSKKDKDKKPLNSETYTLITPLHIAAYNGFLPVVKRLVLAGADIDAKMIFNNQKLDAIELARKNGKNDVIAFLQNELAQKESPVNLPHFPKQTTVVPSGKTTTITRTPADIGRKRPAETTLGGAGKRPHNMPSVTQTPAQTVQPSVPVLNISPTAYQPGLYFPTPAPSLQTTGRLPVNVTTGQPSPPPIGLQLMYQPQKVNSGQPQPFYPNVMPGNIPLSGIPLPNAPFKKT